ncbi:MAG: LysR family transcriptional regulator [Hyphomicrobiales bacterium]|nr:MAG: LysR family transcriptional regulator [Hyphomicrobiales bacterium]
MNWDDLRIIAAVRNRGTYAGASEELRIDETTVARRLARLQEALGFRLFDAVDGVRKPTRQGAEALALIDEMATRASAIGALKDEGGGPTGSIRIASTASVAETVLAPGLADLLNDFPGLAVEIKTSDANLNFSRWEADLAIRLGKPERGAFVIRKLTEVPLYLFRPATPASPDGSEILCAYPQELARTPEMRELAEVGIAGPVRLRTSNVRIIHALVATGSAIGILPRHMAAELLSDERLIATPLKTRREVWLLIQPHLIDEPAARVVIDWIVTRFRSPPQS